MLYGYARRSRDTQEIETQVLILEGLGAEEIIKETGSGKNASRAEWNKLLDRIESGDTLIATEISRLGRDALELLKLRKRFATEGIYLQVGRKTYDFSTKADRLEFGLLSIIFENESETIGERVKRAHDARVVVKPDRVKTKVFSERQEALLLSAHEKGASFQTLANKYKCGKTTVRRAVAAAAKRRAAREALQATSKAPAGDER